MEKKEDRGVTNGVRSEAMKKEGATIHTDGGCEVGGKEHDHPDMTRLLATLRQELADVVTWREADRHAHKLSHFLILLITPITITAIGIFSAPSLPRHPPLITKKTSHSNRCISSL